MMSIYNDRRAVSFAIWAGFSVYLLSTEVVDVEADGSAQLRTARVGCLSRPNLTDISTSR
jgi:hypothetical protein